MTASTMDVPALLLLLHEAGVNPDAYRIFDAQAPRFHVGRAEFTHDLEYASGRWRVSLHGERGSVTNEALFHQRI